MAGSSGRQVGVGPWRIGNDAYEITAAMRNVDWDLPGGGTPDAEAGGSRPRTASCADSSELDRRQWQSCADQGVPPRLAHDVPRQRSTAEDLRALDREQARASGSLSA